MSFSITALEMGSSWFISKDNLASSATNCESPRCRHEAASVCPSDPARKLRPTANPSAKCLMLLAYIQNQTQSRNDSNENWVNSEANKINFETIGSALLLQQRSSNFGGYFSITIFLLFASLASRRFYFCKMCRRDCFMSDVRDLYQLKCSSLESFSPTSERLSFEVLT